MWDGREIVWRRGTGGRPVKRTVLDAPGLPARMRGTGAQGTPGKGRISGAAYWLDFPGAPSHTRNTAVGLTVRCGPGLKQATATKIMFVGLSLRGPGGHD